MILCGTTKIESLEPSSLSVKVILTGQFSEIKNFGFPTVFVVPSVATLEFVWFFSGSFMKIVAVTVLSFLFAISAFAETEPLLGSWRGYCAPVESKSSVICAYVFNKDLKGAWTCQYYADLRCEKLSSKKSTLEFEYFRLSTEKVGIKFKNRKTEIPTLFVVTGDVLRENGVGSDSAPTYYTRVK